MTFVPTPRMHTGPIQAVAFSGANSRAYLSAVFAAYRAGEVVLALPRAPAIDTVPGVTVTARRAFDDDPGWFEDPLDPVHTEDPAQISFSSGTTGRPKAILLPHRALSDVVDRINAAMEIDGSIREYIGVPVTFSFGFGRARAVAAAGGRAFLPERGFDPAEIARMLAAGEINAVSAVPTLWRVVLANPDVIGAAGRKLRWIEIGSQYMAGPEKAALRRLFPNAKIVQHYGLTEASRTALLDITDAPEDRLDSIGRAEGAVEIAVSEGGVILTRGPHVATGLVTEAGVTPLTDADGWLATGDRGRLEDGWLYYEGRTDELINTGGLKIDPARFEQHLVAALGAPDAVAVGRAEDPLRGEQVLVAIQRGAGLGRRAVETAAIEIAEAFGLQGRGALTFREVDEIPRTATGKVRRAVLAELPASGPALVAPPDPVRPAAPPADATRAAELQALWAEILGTDTVSVHESFYDLGGDSLSALTAILRMEALGIDPDTARGLLDGKTIAEITGLAGGPGETAETGSVPAENGSDAPPAAPALTLAEAMNAVHAARGVLALWVVVVHWLPGVLVRIGASLDIYTAMIPVLRFGTPGFAMVFGLGIGALRIPHFRANPALFRRSVRFSTMLVVGGVLILALLKAALLLAEGSFGDRMTPSALFYSVISYYALALLTLPLLMRIVTIGPNTFLTLLACAVVSGVIHEVLHAHFAALQPNGVLELLKVLFTAKYGFFRMTVFVLIGAAIGWYFRQNHDRPGLPRDLVVAGAVLAGAGVLTLYLAQPDNMWRSFNVPRPWHLAVYAGVLLWILAGFSVLNRAGGTRPPWALRRLNALAIASGMLALPIFVGHEIVIPAKALLEIAGLPEALALALPLAAFLGALGFAYLRLMRYFAR